MRSGLDRSVEPWLGDKLEIAWRWTYTYGISIAIESFDRAWVLDSVTIHNIMAEAIPAVDAPIQRVFFATQPPDETSQVEHDLMCAETRSMDIANAITLLGPPDESSYEFVNVACPVCMEKGDVDGEADLMEKPVWRRLSQPGLRETVEPQVKFLVELVAESSGCCSEK